MQFEHTGKDDFPYLVTFEGDEIKTVCAVFREEMFDHAKKGNVGSISDYDADMGDWDDMLDTLPTKLNSVDRMIERLERFHDATDDAIVSFAQEATWPPFLNDDIIVRRRMGKHALELANQLSELSSQTPHLRDINVEAVDFEAELARLTETEEPQNDSNDED